MSEDTPTPTLEDPIALSLCDSDPEIISDRYVILGILGEGGMGKVYLAEDNAIKRSVAVKVLRFEDSASLLGRFHQEAKALAKLNHPGIVTAFDFGLIDGRDPYLVMDYIEGETLDLILKKQGNLKLEEFRNIFSQITKSMQYAHDQGIVHRDLKPSNIIVRRSKGKTEAFILDFGISKVLHDKDTQYQTKTGQIVGSPKYVSPEQVSNGAADARSDIYALGCVMYEALAGSPPFAGESVMETLKMHLEEEPVSLFERSGQRYSDRLEMLISRTLKKNKEDRIQSMQLLNNALQESEEEVVEEVSSSKIVQSKKTLVALSILVGVGVVFAGLVIVPSKTKNSISSVQKTVSPVKPIIKQKIVEKIKWSESKIEETSGIFTPSRVPTVGELATLKRMHGSHFVGLILDGYEVKKELMIWIKDNGIKYLFLRNSKLSLDSYDYIKNLDSITVLYFGGSTTIDGIEFGDKHIKTLAKLPNLVRLSFKDSRVSNVGAKLFKSFPKLNHLDLTGNLLTDEGVKYLSELKTLKTLHLSGMTEITGVAIYNLKKSSVVNLYLYNTSLIADDWKLFKLLPQLEYLGIGNPGQTLTGAQLKPLTTLNLRVLKNINFSFF